MLTSMLAVVAVSAIFAGGRGFGKLKERQYLIQKTEEAAFMKGYFQPGRTKMEGNFTGGGGKRGMGGFNVQTQPGDGATVKPVRGGMLEGISVGMQLTAVEGDLGRFRFGGLEVHHGIGAIVEADHSVDLASQEAAQGMPGQADGYRLDPLLGNTHKPGGQGRVKLGGRATSELGFHQAVDGAKDGGEGCGRAADSMQVFEVETARAFIP